LVLIIFALLHLKRRGIVLAVCISATLIGAAWFASPALRERAGSVISQYDLYKQSNEATSVGLRLEFLAKVAAFFSEAPLFGHGTGSTRGLFLQAAAGQTGAAGEVIDNPHNQTLNVAVPVGRLGILVLYSMWFGPLVNISRQRFGKLHRTTGGNSECYELTFQLASVRLPRGVDVRPGRRGCWWNDDEGKSSAKPRGRGQSLFSLENCWLCNSEKWTTLQIRRNEPAEFHRPAAGRQLSSVAKTRGAGLTFFHVPAVGAYRWRGNARYWNACFAPPPGLLYISRGPEHLCGFALAFFLLYGTWSIVEAVGLDIEIRFVSALNQ